MEQNTNSRKKPLLERIADQLIKDQQELDRLAVQFSLGKAEVKDHFEAAKKMFRDSMHAYKVELFEEYHHGEEKLRDLKTKFEHLDEKLAEVRADTWEKFEHQRQNILKAMEDVKQELKENPNVTQMSNFFTAASEKAKLEFDLMAKNWDKASTEFTQNFQDEMKTAGFKIKEIMDKAKDKKGEMDEKMSDFNAEIKEAYEHFKKAFRSF